MTQSLTRVLLVRHGATTSSAEDRFAGSSDVMLSDDGRHQVTLLGDRLATWPIAAAYSSDMQRARDTAAAIADRHHLAATSVPALREIDHGHWEGIRHHDVEKQFAQEYADWSADPLTNAPPGGETGLSVLGRSVSAVREIVNRHAGRTILVVSHKATNRLLLAYLLGMDVRRYRDRLSQDLACLNIIEFTTFPEPRVILINDTSHYATQARGE
jgi:probable phosphoglycerate mutase